MSILNDQKKLFFILLPKIPTSYPKIKLCMYISSLHYQHFLSCTILFQTPPTCSPSEGRGRSYREDVEIQETSKLQKAGDEQLYHKKKTNKTKTKCRNSQLRPQFGYSCELLLDIQAC